MSRQVVLLREGPPKRRGAVVDAVTGVLGVLLLIGAGVLGEVLPEEDIIPVQYTVSFPTNNTDAFFVGPESGQPVKSLLFNQNNPFTHGETKQIPFTIEHDNVVSLTVQIFIPGDDVPSSRPDVFGFEVFRPDGTPAGLPYTVSTVEPQERLPSDPATLPEFDPDASTWFSPDVTHAQAFRQDAAPSSEKLSGENGEDIGEAAAIRFAFENYTRPSAGTWIIEVTLRQTGDCPGPGTDAAANRREADCQKITQDAGNRGQDETNQITLKSIRYDYYDIVVTPPE